MLAHARLKGLWVRRIGEPVPDIALGTARPSTLPRGAILFGVEDLAIFIVASCGKDKRLIGVR